MKSKRLLWVLPTLLALLAAGVPPRLAQGQASTGYIVVTSFADELETSPACSLREAIIAANENRAVGGCEAGSSEGEDIIRIAPGITQIILTLGGPGEDLARGGDLDILGSVKIEGATGGTSIRVVESMRDRVFDIRVGNGRVLLRHLKVNQGQPSDVRLGGAVYLRSGSLKIEYSQFNMDEFLVPPANAPSSGGAIFSGDGTSLEIIGTSFTDLMAGRGGAIFSRGSADIRYSFFARNEATDPRGGGGGVYYNAPDGEFRLTNNTFYLNVGQAGTEIFSDGPSLILNNNTIVGGGEGDSAPVYIGNFSASLRNTIVLHVNPAGRTCAFSGDPSQPPLVSGGNNLENSAMRWCNFSQVSDVNVPGQAAGSVVELSPGTSHSAGQGTPYLWLPGGSAAINHGAGCAPTDQRGIYWIRPFGPGTTCDIGAIEVEAVEIDPYPIYLPSIRR